VGNNGSCPCTVPNNGLRRITDGEVYDWSGSFVEYDPYTGTVNWTLTNEAFRRGLGADGDGGRRTRLFYQRFQPVQHRSGATHQCLVDQRSFRRHAGHGHGLVYVHSNAFVNAYTTNGDFVRKYDTGLSYETLLAR